MNLRKVDARSPKVLTAIGVAATLALALLVGTLLLYSGADIGFDNALVIAGLIISGGVFTSQLVNGAIQDRRSQAASLQKYFAEVGKLLIEQPSGQASPGDNLSTVVRVQTLAVLGGALDSDRKRILLEFLYESGLIRNDKPVVSLSAANLSEANLRRANLSGVNLSEANLSYANLSEANLSGANLSGANLSYAELNGAELSNTNLSGAKVTEEQLQAANPLEGAIMPDGSKHP